MGSLYRLSTEKNSEIWIRPTVISHTVKFLMLLIAIIANYYVSDVTTSLTKMWILVGFLVAETFVSVMVMEVLKQLRATTKQ